MPFFLQLFLRRSQKITQHARAVPYHVLSIIRNRFYPQQPCIFRTTRRLLFGSAGNISGMPLWWMLGYTSRRTCPTEQTCICSIRYPKTRAIAGGFNVWRNSKELFKPSLAVAATSIPMRQWSDSNDSFSVSESGFTAVLYCS